jgi:hypothetical protein
MLEVIDTALTGGLLITAIFWVIRTIRKDRKDKRDHYDRGEIFSRKK